MSLEAKLYDRLSTLISNVYPMVAPQDYKKPAVIYNRIGTEAWDNLAGDDEGAEIEFQIDVYDTDHSAAKDLATVIRKNLRKWKDTDIQGCKWTGELDMIDATTETTLYRVKLTFTVFAQV